MLLTPGSKLGPYEAVAPLGAGAMGSLDVFEGWDRLLSHL